MATKATTKNISFQRNRDYSVVFQWNSTLNDDVYKFYLQARENPQKGYMRRLKHLWDEKYPMFTHFRRNTYEKEQFSSKRNVIPPTTDQT